MIGFILLEKLCKKCGKLMNENDVFCFNCQTIVKRKLTLLGFFGHLLFTVLAIDSLTEIVILVLVCFKAIPGETLDYGYFGDYYGLFLILLSIASVGFLAKNGVIPLVLPIAKYRKDNDEASFYKSGDYAIWSLLSVFCICFFYACSILMLKLIGADNKIINLKMQLHKYYWAPLGIVVLLLPIILAIFGKLPFAIRRKTKG